MDATKSGNGYSSPFGNGNGAGEGGASSGSHDFVSSPSMPSGGKGLDVTKQTAEQKTIDPMLLPNSVPDGGEILKVDAPAREGMLQGVEPTSKPFKV